MDGGRRESRSAVVDATIVPGVVGERSFGRSRVGTCRSIRGAPALCVCLRRSCNWVLIFVLVNLHTHTQVYSSFICTINLLICVIIAELNKLSPKSKANTLPFGFLSF